MLKTARIRIVVSLILFLLFLPSSGVAAPTTAEQAQIVVAKWLSLDQKPLGAVLGHRVKEVQPFQDENGEVIYYAVNLYPQGMVIVAANDLVEPIIAFVPQGKYDPSPTNPLGALVSQDMRGRIAKAREVDLKMQVSGAPLTAATPWVAAQRKWIWLEYDSSLKPLQASGLEQNQISDLRVAALVQTKWNQGFVCTIKPCFNYFTVFENNYYLCGCTATAMAQLMRFHRYPTTGVGTKIFSITVDDKEQKASLLGGDNVGGPYEWDKMEFDPGCFTSEEQRQAIGGLTYDAGLSVNMKYKYGEYWGLFGQESGAPVVSAANALRTTFKYSNAIGGYNDNNSISLDYLYNMLNPNLDTMNPVLLGIFTTKNNGHAIICDGYGFNAGSMYHHLNMGYSGKYDAWYNLPNIDTSEHQFKTIQQCVYNIFKNKKGEIISGRVLDYNNNPLTGATVTATAGGKTYKANSHNGIFGIVGLPSNTTFTVSVSQEGNIFFSKQIPTKKSEDNSPNCGNVWGVDFKANTPEPKTGGVKGTLRDGSPKGQKLNDVDVTCGERKTKSKSDGTYILSDIPAGPQPLTFSKSGYESKSRTITITAGMDYNAGEDYLVKKEAKKITIINPTSSDEWATDETHDIKWTSQGLDNEQVSITYSLDDGKTWKEIRGATNNDGGLSWNLKEYISTTKDYDKARIKVAWVKDSKISAVSERFTIAGAEKKISVTNPTKEDVWGAERSHPIRWKSNNLSSKDNVKISCSLNGGEDWYTITPETRNDGEYGWDFRNDTNITKDHGDAKIRVASVKYPKVYGSSDTFTILSPNPGPMNITVTSPAPGEVWTSDVAHTIRWTTTPNISPKAEMRIDYSLDDGAKWNLIDLKTPNDGNIPWDFSKDPKIRNTDKARIRVLYRNRPEVAGISERFTIKIPEPKITITGPAAGEVWTSDVQHTVRWTTEGISKDGEMTIEYSLNDGNSWTRIVDVTPNDWNRPWDFRNDSKVQSTDQARIRVIYRKNTNVIGVSGRFSIRVGEPPGTVSVNPPGGAWTSSPQYISASCPGASRIFITLTSTLDGSDPPEPREPSSSQHDAHIDNDPKTLKLEAELGEYKKIRVRFRGAQDYGYGPPTGSFLYIIDLRPGQVSVDPPSGYWNSSPVDVSASCPGASRIFITFTTTLDGSEPPEPREPSSSQHDAHIDNDPKTFKLEAGFGQYKRYKVRFRGAIGYGYGPATGSYAYTIDMVVPPPPQIIITNPTPGEQWKADKERYIEWTPLNFPPGQHMHVSYSFDDGNRWYTLDSYTENDGSKRWDMKNDNNINKGTYPQSRIRIMWAENQGVQMISERFTVKKD